MRIIIDVKPQHRNLFIEMAKAVKAKVEIVPEEKKRTKEEFLDNLENSLRETKLHAEGKIELPTLKEFLNEL
jgi:hypothetical protein